MDFFNGFFSIDFEEYCFNGINVTKPCVTDSHAMMLEMLSHLKTLKAVHLECLDVLQKIIARVEKKVPLESCL